MNQLAALFPQLTEEKARIALATYRLLAGKDLVSTQDLAKATGVGEQVVEDCLVTWPGVFRDHTGGVIGFWGLTGQKMNHTMMVSGKARYAWCAWDTLFIPEILCLPAIVEATSGLDHHLVRLSVTPDSVVVDAAIEDPVYVSFRLPTDANWEQEVVTTFCHHVHFLLGEEAERWVDRNQGGVVLPLEHAFIAGQRKNSSQFGAALSCN